MLQVATAPANGIVLLIDGFSRLLGFVFGLALIFRPVGEKGFWLSCG